MMQTGQWIWGTYAYWAYHQAFEFAEALRYRILEKSAEVMIALPRLGEWTMDQRWAW